MSKFIFVFAIFCVTAVVLTVAKPQNLNGIDFNELKKLVEGKNLFFCTLD